MGYGAESSFVGIVAAVVGIVLILTVVLRMWKKVPQDKAGVVTGMKKRVITGGGGLVIPVFERIDYISLGNIPLSVATRSSLSSQGVPISVITTAVIKVRNEKGSILTAIEQFTGRNEKEIIDNIQGTAIAVLEGKLREIIATMTVEELYQKREEFSSRVQEVVGTELGNMGLEVKNFTITDISDENGYIKALGDGMIAQRKKDAEIQKAEAARDMQIKTSQARQEGESAKLKAEADIAQAAKDKAVLEANYMQEQQTAQAKAELAHDIQSNITQKDVIQAQMDAELLKQQRQKEIAEAQIQVQIASEQKNIELAQKQAERTKESLRVTIVEPANAEKAKQMADADAEKYRKIAEAEARAESRKVEAQAEAEAIALKAQKRFIILCTRIAREKFSVSPEREKAFDMVRQFYVLVDNHFKEKKMVQDYADMLHRSPKTLSNLFTTCGLPSPLRIIHERIEAEAKRLLLYSQKSAKEITEILGFEDQATFSRFFKKMTGESVSEYRKREKRE